MKIGTAVENTNTVLVFDQTIRHGLAESVLRGRVPRKKPFVIRRNGAKSLKFAKGHINKPLSY